MEGIRGFIDLLLRLFALGLFLSIVLDWILSRPPSGFRRQLNRFYEIFLQPVRRFIKPLKLSPRAPAGLDLSPLLLLFLVWWFVHPFLMWVLGA